MEKNLETKKNIAMVAEEIAYSSKGHFKSADWIKISLSIYILVPLLFSLIIFIWGDYYKIFSFISLFFSILAINSSLANNRDIANKEIKRHMEIGNNYLEIYKELRNSFSNVSSVDINILDSYRKRISLLDNQSNNCNINFAGRIWSKVTIKKEMDMSWIYKILE